MRSSIRFENGFVLTSNAADRVLEKIFEVMKKELPEEALAYTVIKHISQEILESVDYKKINL